jgi:hypothetical protein
MNNEEHPRNRASRLQGLAKKARDNGLTSYAEQLEDIATEAAAEAERQAQRPPVQLRRGSGSSR